MFIRIIIASFLFLLSVILIGQNLDKPFWGEHDWNGVRYGNIARNYLRYGILETKLGQVENSGIVGKGDFEYYTHYPPLLPLAIGLSYKIFGVSEWSTRIVPLLTTAGSIVLIFLIGTNYNLKIGIVAALLSLITPLSLYFGKNASHEPLALFFILLSLYGYISLRRLRHAKLIFISGLVLAQLTAWAGFFLIPALALTHLLRREGDKFKELIPYWILSVALFGFHLLHIKLLTGSIAGGELFESLLQRSGLAQDPQPAGFNLPNYLNQLRLWFSTLYTLTLTILATFWLVIRRFNIKGDEWPIFSLGLIGVIYIILFSNSVFIHNYLIFYFLPLLSLTGTRTIFLIKEKYDTLVYHTKFKKTYLRFISDFIILFFLALIIFERRDFLTALHISQQDKFTVEVGKAINRNSKPEDLILVSPLKYQYSADKFLRFYSDRKIIYSDEEITNYNVWVKVYQNEGKFEIIRKDSK